MTLISACLALFASSSILCEGFEVSGFANIRVGKLYEYCSSRSEFGIRPCRDCAKTRRATTACFSTAPLPYFVESPPASLEKEYLLSPRSPSFASKTRVLSGDPRVIVVDDLLSESECRALIDRALAVDADPDDPRRLARSNPPEASLSIARLAPLPLLCLASGSPPFLRTLDVGGTIDAAVAAASPNVAAAVAATFALVAVAPTLARRADLRTSDAVALNAPDDVDLVRPLVERATASLRRAADPADAELYDWRCWEAPVVTRYSEDGAKFAVHNDASRDWRAEWGDAGGQRVVTVILYLTDVREGGGTAFPELEIEVRPTRGRALVFFPADRSTLEADDRTRHESRPTVPGGGTKWIVQLFGRAGRPRTPPPLGLPDEYGRVAGDDGERT